MFTSLILSNLNFVIDLCVLLINAERTFLWLSFFYTFSLELVIWWKWFYGIHSTYKWKEKRNKQNIYANLALIYLGLSIKRLYFERNYINRIDQIDRINKTKRNRAKCEQKLYKMNGWDRWNKSRVGLTTVKLLR